MVVAATRTHGPNPALPPPHPASLTAATRSSAGGNVPGIGSQPMPCSFRRINNARIDES